MKSSFLKIGLLSLLSIFALNACSMKCPFSGDDKPATCGQGKCEKEGCCKAEGKTCGGEAATGEKKSCCGK